MCATPSRFKQQWLIPPEELDLNEGEVHVWRGIVDIPSLSLQVYWETLNSEERDRAHRFRFSRHQSRFIAARGMLRSLLGFYLDRFPYKIELGVGPQGKPFVSNPVVRKLCFNISHSQRIALFVFSRESEVGIDVEGPRPRLDYQAVAKRVLSQQEQRWMQSLPASKQKTAFLTCWTRKEALVKAHGTGLFFPFYDTTVTFLSTQPPGLVNIEDPWLNNRPWAMCSVYPMARYIGAFVVAGQPQIIHYWDYQQWRFQSKGK